MYNTAISILKELNNNNFEAYIVGGYPRDKYLNIKSDDIDICTNACPEEINKIFDNVDLKNKKYGNAIVYKNNYKFEITIFRKDSNYIKNRRPDKVEFVNSLAEDLKRRDFIINTLCIDSNENYIDLLGAINDINNKTIRLVGNKESLYEDALRILRAIRFMIILDFNFDEELIDGIKQYGFLVGELSANRKKDELEKILKFKNKNYVFKILKKYGLDKYLEINN